MVELEFRSCDLRFGLHIPSAHLAKLVRACEKAGSFETGGILVGYYTSEHDYAIVSNFSGPPSDSRTGSTWFHRGIRALQEWLHLLWLRKTHYYLGEWHFHPYGDPDPSPTDIEQMESISRSEKYRCPEPVLVVVGPTLKPIRARAFVFPMGSPYLELHLVKSGVHAMRCLGSAPSKRSLEQTQTRRDDWMKQARFAAQIEPLARQMYHRGTGLR